MVNESEANQARQRHGRDLLRRGAHAIGVEEGERYGKKGWVVVAYVASQGKVDMPSTLNVSDDEQGVKVPVVTIESEPFKPD